MQVKLDLSTSTPPHLHTSIPPGTCLRDVTLNHALVSRLLLPPPRDLAGTCLITLDGVGGGEGGAALTAAQSFLGGASPLLSTGDVALLVATIFYALATVRLGFYAPRFPSVRHVYMLQDPNYLVMIGVASKPGVQVTNILEWKVRHTQDPIE